MIDDHVPDLKWTYTFCDLRSGAELATFELTGVKFSRNLCAVGSFDGFLSLLDPDVRAKNPWALTRQRRTALYIEVQDVADPALPEPICLWGGVVWGRRRGAKSTGLTLRGASFESWLHRQRVAWPHIPITSVGANDLIAQMLVWVQTSAADNRRDIGLAVSPPAVPDLGWVRRTIDYAGREGKTMLELLEDLRKSGAPVEFRIDCARGVDGKFVKTLLMGEPRIGRAWADTGLTGNYPDGALLDWDLDEDGSEVDTSLIVTGSGSGDDQAWVLCAEEQLGIGEIAAGFPGTVGKLALSNESDVNILTALGLAEIRRRYANEMVLGSLKLRTDAMPLIGSYLPGDDFYAEIAHITMESYPAETLFQTRLLGFECAPGSGQVALLVGT